MKTTTHYRCALTAAATLALAAGALAGSDFNGDGIQDLAIGVPGESVGNAGGGIVQVFYGKADTGIQLNSPPDQIWHQNVTGIEGVCESGDGFGQVLATGDFNNDGFDDLAIGVPNEDIDNPNDNLDIQIVDAGMVSVIYGSANGLKASGDQAFVQGRDGVSGTVKFHSQRFGTALAAGDFDGDGWCDLAIGTPNDRVNDIVCGAVQLMHGTPNGLVPWKYLHQNSPGILGANESGDSFGAALASTDFGDDGVDDLAIGVPGEDVFVTENNNVQNCGMVQVVYGTPLGLTDIDQTWNQGLNGLLGSSGTSEAFGSSLAAGRTQGNQFVPSKAFLAARVPSDNASPAKSGSIVILAASMASDRLVSTNNRVLNLDVIPGFTTPDGTEQFGSTLLIADFGRNAFPLQPTLDLAIGAPNATVSNPNGGGQVKNAGAVFVVYDMGAPVNPDKVERWGQGVVGGIAGSPAEKDQFGFALAAGNFGRSTHTDLAIGIPGEDSGLTNIGAVQVIYSTGDAGLEPANNQLFTQNTVGVDNESAEGGEALGAALGR